VRDLTWRNPRPEGLPFGLSNIFTSLEAYFAKAKYKDFTVPITATTVNPTLGTGGYAKARYAVHGKTVHLYGQVVFGAGATAGTGSYSFHLPTPVAEPFSFPRIGFASCYDSSTGDSNMAWAYKSTGVQTFSLMYPITNTVDFSQYYGSNVPWVWANGDTIDFNLVYETE
jgi:hypothetical protein